MIEKETFVTYWPHSGSFYVGKHTEKDPGLDSSDLLGVTRKVESPYKTELKSESLIQSTKQITSEIAVANQADLSHLQVIRLHEEIMGRP